MLMPSARLPVCRGLRHEPFIAIGDKAKVLRQLTIGGTADVGQPVMCGGVNTVEIKLPIPNALLGQISAIRGGVFQSQHSR